MNEVEKKEIDEMAIIIENGSGEIVTAVKTAKRLISAGYGKVEDYKKQLETDEEYEKNLNDVINKQLAEIADYKKEIERLKARINTLEIALEEISQSQNILREDNEHLKQALEWQFTFKTTQEGKTCNIFDIFRRVAIKEFAEKLKDKFNGYEATSYNGYEEGWHDLQEEIDDLLKKYGIGKE